jgi:Glycosyltransferase family 87
MGRVQARRAQDPISARHRQMSTTRLLSVCSVLAFLLICAGWAYFATVFPETGWDFPQFYIAGSIPVRSLYEQAAYTAWGQQALGGLGVEYFPPYVRPAVFSLPLRLLAFLPYQAALILFLSLQFACFGVCLFLVFRRFSLPLDLLPIFGLFYPALMGIVTGQDPHVLALLVFAGFLLLEGGRDAAARAVWALCLYKFNLILWLPLLLIVRRRWTALGGFSAVGSLLAVASALLSPPGAYLALLENIEKYTIAFSPEKMIGLRGLVLQLGWPPLLYPLGCVVLLGVGIPLLRKFPLAEAFQLAVLGSILSSYHVNWYDGVLVMLPLGAALSRGSSVSKVLAVILLTLFPLWTKPQFIAVILLVLWIALAWAGRRAGTGGVETAPQTTP